MRLMAFGEFLVRPNMLLSKRFRPCRPALTRRRALNLIHRHPKLRVPAFVYIRSDAKPKLT
jgi:hypothetical protein